MLQENPLDVILMDLNLLTNFSNKPCQIMKVIVSKSVCFVCLCVCVNIKCFVLLCVIGT